MDFSKYTIIDTNNMDEFHILPKSVPWNIDFRVPKKHGLTYIPLQMN